MATDMITEWQKASIDRTLGLVRNACKIDDLVEAGRHLFRMRSMNQNWFVNAVAAELEAKIESFVPRKKKILLMDSSMIFCTAWFASKGVDSAGAAMSITHSIAEYHSSAVPIMTADCGPTWRHREFPGYKADRKDKPPGFKEGRKEYMEMLADRYPPVSLADYEADDVIATLATTASILGHQTVVCSNDTDAWQLLGENVSVWTKKEGYLTHDMLFESKGLKPEQVIDYLCCIGKDEVPKPKGIGEVNAKKILLEHGNLDTAVASGRGTTTIEKSLREFFDSTYILSKKLHTLNRTLDIRWRW